MSKRPLGYAIIPTPTLAALVGDHVAAAHRSRLGYSVVYERTLLDCPGLDGPFAQRVASLGGCTLDPGEPLTFLAGGLSPEEIMRRHGL